MSLPVILLGAGGHARVLLDILFSNHVDVIGYVDKQKAENDIGISYMGMDKEVQKFSTDAIVLVNGVGRLDIRCRLFKDFKALGYVFLQVLHPSAIISAKTTLAEGVQVMAGAVVQTGVSLGENVIINTRSSVDHDCVIGRHSHIAAGSVLAGDVSIGERSLIGAGSTVVNGVRIGDDSIIGAGAAVIHDVHSGKTVVGVPAREIN